MFRRALLYIIPTAILAADQAAKIFLINFLRPHETIPIIKDIFHITLVLNTGCAFGLLRNQASLFFIIISTFAIIFLFCHLKKIKGDFILEFAAIFVIAGSLSNLIDRFRLGYVIDFLDFRVWPVFNLGDSTITIGVFIFIFRVIVRNRLQ